ncbi:Major facilitator superfamily domain-containing protein 4B [Halotydeus destructor]|nr:Major facilitator superfamily domain-containing protein 4B [Halotydeus destructor]
MTSTGRKTKLIFTGANCFTYVTFGIGVSIFGPTLPGLTQQINSNQHDIAYALTARAAMYIFASLFFGKLFDVVNRQVGLVLGLCGCALTLGLVPICQSLTQLIANQVAYGATQAAVEVVLNAWVLELWKEDSNPYMQTMHFSYALGSFIGPFICEPFLTSTAIIDPFFKVSLFSTPFFIASAAAILSVLVQWYLFLSIPYTAENRAMKTPRDDADIDSSDGHHVFSLPKYYFFVVVSLGAIVLCFEGGIEMNTFNYLATFIINTELKISESKAAIMNGVLNGGFMVSRFISIFLATRMKTINMLYMNLTIIMIGNVLIWTCANLSEAGLWLGVVTLGFGFSSSWPGVFALIEERINATNIVCAIFMSATMLHAAIGPLIEGKFIDKTPMIFVYLNFVSGVICCLAFGLLHATDKIRKTYIGLHVLN